MRRRLPALQEILPVYVVITTAVFSWSIVALIWKLPSWMLFLDAGEILSIFSYTFSVNLLESLLWLVVLLVAAILLPPAALRDQFAVRGAIVSLFVLISLALYINRYAEWGQKLLDYSSVWIVGTLLVSILMAFLSSRIATLGSGVLRLADRLTIFLFLYIPLAIISLIVVLIRNMF